MKFIRNERIRERVVDIATKTLLLAVSALACLWMISGARAGTAEITAIHQGNAGTAGEYAVDFAFSSPVSKEDVAVDFQRNFIQVSLKNVSAYPARTEKLSHSLLEKVFTYQYQPDLARARILLKVPANSLEGESRWEVTPQGLRIVVKGGTETIAAATPVKKEIKAVKDTVKVKSAATKAAPAAPATPAASEDPEDALVVKQILEESKKPLTEIAVTKKAESSAAITNTEEQPIFAAQTNAAIEQTNKAKTSPIARVIASLLLVVGVIGAGAIAYRRFVLGRGMPFQRSANRMIEMITTQSLGPKRSVAIIRVLDQYMVVGMSGDNMNLLANLGTSINLDKYSDDIGTGASFADTFQGALGGISASANPVSKAVEESPKADFRSMIKKRMEGFKPL